jgi:hypothetical protein
LLANLADATTDNLFNKCRVKTGAIKDSFLHNAEQFAGVQGGQTAIALADWGAQGVDDYY